MIIETKDWYAQNDLMPSPQGPCLRITGTVVVANPGIEPVLSMRAIQDKSFVLALELTSRELDGIHLQVVTEKSVRFELPGDHRHVPWVTIFHEGRLLTTIKEIEETH